MPAEQLYNRIRGFNPWPCCHCRIPAARSGARRLRVLRAAVGAGVGKPGELLDTGADGPLVAAGEGALRLLEVQPEGRRVMSGADFLRGHELEPGIRLE